MNPFGLQLRYFRKERGISFKLLAEKIGISEKIISAIETGRRSPLKPEQLGRACNALELASEECAALEQAALDSISIIRIPEQTSPREYRLVHRIVRSLGALSAKKIAAIHALFDQREIDTFTGGKNMTK